MNEISYNRDTLIMLLVEKSERNLEQAIKNSELGYWDLVANRLYYSVFHAVNALLMTDGIKTGTHKGTSAIFGKHYILTGKFKREDGILYSRLQTMREIADYRNTFTLSETEGAQLIEKAKELQNRIIEFVKQQN